MIGRLKNRYKFYIERVLLRGARYQLLFIAFLIVLVSLAAGTIVYVLLSDFKGIDHAVWWAFLRLTDPGYLGDDKGLLLGAVSTVVTVLGYVLFMGALIAILTQWLNSKIRSLESGLTPITQNDHVLILGWTNRTPTIVRELVLSEGRVKRFLRRIGASRLHIVILAEEVSSALAYELREALGPRWDEKQITLRSGSPLRIEHLRRVDFMNAGVIILPGADFKSEGSEVLDTWTIKALLSISNYGSEQRSGDFPLVVAEVFDAEKISIARNSYQGEIELISSDSLISRLITQNVRHRGLSHVYTELLTHNEGNGIFIREFPELSGARVQDLGAAFPGAIVLGVLRPEDGGFTPLLNPPGGFEVQRDDHLVFLAGKYSQTEISGGYREESFEKGAPEAYVQAQGKRKILIMGWSRKVPSLIQEFGSYGSEMFQVDVISQIPIAEREEALSCYDLDLTNVHLTQLYGDYTTPSHLRHLDPGRYDNIVLVSSGRMDSNEESDARTILGYLILRDMLPKGTSRPEILIEMMDPENERLFQQRAGEVLISPLILSHITAHVALRRDLKVVFEELFTVGGAEIYFRPRGWYDLEEGEKTFEEISRAVALKGDIALGVKKEGGSTQKGGDIFLNPSRDTVWKMEGQDEIVVLTTYI